MSSISKPTSNNVIEESDYFCSCCPKTFPSANSLCGHQNAHRRQLRLAPHHHFMSRLPDPTFAVPPLSLHPFTAFHPPPSPSFAFRCHHLDCLNSHNNIPNAIRLVHLARLRNFLAKPNYKESDGYQAAEEEEEDDYGREDEGDSSDNGEHACFDDLINDEGKEKITSAEELDLNLKI